MRKIMVRAAILQTLFFCNSGSATETFNITGMSALSCGKVVAAMKSEVQRVEIADFLNGYVVAYNYYGSKPVTPPDNETSLVFIERFCKNNPLSILMTGGAALVEELGGEKSQSPYKH